MNFFSPLHPSDLTAGSDARARRIQMVVFLLVLPLFNASVVAAVLIDLGRFAASTFILIAFKLWLVFALSFILIRALEYGMGGKIKLYQFWWQFLLHCPVVIAVSAIVGSTVQPVLVADSEYSMVAPRIFMLLQVAFYLGFIKLISERDLVYAEQASRQAMELSMLRSQSNPHFLFNTLNLITSEISRNPVNAKEIVYDLADLLRSNIKIARERWVLLDDELKLVDLYLRLQKKRFADRLTYTIDVDPKAKRLALPSLLLQPVIENTIKHAVAPSTSLVTVSVVVKADNDRVLIEFRDSAAQKDTTVVNEGNGFRILRQTLRLNYGADFNLQFKSTPAGGRLLLDIPNSSGIKA